MGLQLCAHHELWLDIIVYEEGDRPQAVLAHAEGRVAPQPRRHLLEQRLVPACPYHVDRVAEVAAQLGGELLGSGLVSGRKMVQRKWYAKNPKKSYFPKKSEASSIRCNAGRQSQKKLWREGGESYERASAD